MHGNMNKMAHVYRRVKGFISREVWSTDIRELSWIAGFLYRVLRFVDHTVSSFFRDRCLLRASALTYASLLSLVPFLALMFSILKGLGVQKRLEPILLERFTGGSQEVVSRILEYIDRTNVGSLGVAGVLTLLVTVVMVMKNMERSFNWIWKIRKGRSWMRTVSDYLSVLVITPFSILVAITLTTYFSSHGFIERMETIWLLGDFYRFLIKLAPFVVLWIAFTVCYIFLPNTRVRIDAAALGGIIGGTLWQFAQWGYVRYQIGMAKYNAIYGALSQLPILLVWIYVSWVILLFGAEIAFAYQNLSRYRMDKLLSLQKRPSAAYLTLQTLNALVRRFVRGEFPYSLDRLSESLGVPRSKLMRSLRRLEEIGWVASIGGQDIHIVFRRPPDQMPLHQVLCLNKDGERGDQKENLTEILRRADGGIISALEGLTVRDLLELEQPESLSKTMGDWPLPEAKSG